MNKGDPPAVAYPRSFSSIAASVGGLAIFLVLASALLVSQSIGSTVSDYFYGVGHSAKPSLSWTNSTVNDPSNDSSNDLRIPDSVSPGFNDTPNRSDVDSGRKDNSFSNGDSVENVSIVSLGLSNNSDTIQPGLDGSSSETIQLGLSNSSETIQPGLDGSSSETIQPGPSNSSETIQPGLDGSSSETIQPGLSNSSETIQPGLDGSSSLTPENANQSEPTEADCDLYHGEWAHDPAGPLYTNNSCPVLSQTQNCQGNGRPDKDYESWRWKPSQCDLPRFDGRKFLELMRGKTLAFIGDSVARNQMESLLCILWQVEVPKNRGNKKMQRYYFRSTSTMIVRIWSSWLVHQTPESFDYAPEGVVKLHLDKPDEGFMQHIPTFDVVVLSSGHWFAKQSVYVLHDEIVGGQLWWLHKSRPMKVNNVEAFGISVETILTSMATHPNYTGLTIVRSFSPDHYEGGAWNTGGSCTGKVQPAEKLVENGFTNIMHDKQVAGFNSAVKKITNRSKLKLMDITEAFGYRHDGHPGPYRNPDPNKITTRGPDGKPPPQDCLHWCMPGPVDTWNELVLEIIRREL